MWKNFVVWIRNCDVTNIGMRRHQLFSACLSNFVQCFISPLNAFYLQYTLSTYATLTSAHKSVLFNLFVIVEPLTYLRVCHGIPINKNLKKEVLVKKSNILLVNTSTNEQLLQKLKNKKFNDSVVLAFLECSCYIQTWVIRQKRRISIMSRPIFKLWQLNYIWSASD